MVGSVQVADALAYRHMGGGSDGSTAVEGVKLMKLLWDAVGTEFGGRHELYERNYAGPNDGTHPRPDVTGRHGHRPGGALLGLCRTVYGGVRPGRLDGARVDYPERRQPVSQEIQVRVVWKVGTQASGRGIVNHRPAPVPPRPVAARRSCPWRGTGR